MIHLNQFVREQGLEKKTFALIGKGPSYARIDGFDLSDMVTVSLNHVIRERQVDIAHLIDFDVFETCADEIMRNSRYLLMPMTPHIDGWPTAKTLHHLIRDDERLQSLDCAGRLIWYNLRGSRKHLRPWLLKARGYPPVNRGAFSSDTLVLALALADIRRIRTIGVDGGKQYSSSFEDLESRTLLINQQESFDSQFRQLRQCIDEYDLSYRPLVNLSPIKVFVGTADAQQLAVDVLDYSIRRHTRADVEVIPLNTIERDYRQPADPENRPRTPFSFQRFLIPEACGHEGRAIYVDSDMQVFRDIADLWSVPLGDNDLLSCLGTPGRIPHYSVMLLDCAALQWNIDTIVDQLDSGELDYASLMMHMTVAKRPAQGLSRHWNALETFDPARTCLLHYTDMETQPWIYGPNPLGALWVSDLLKAIGDRVITREQVADHVDRGWVRPSLLCQVDRNEPQFSTLPANEQQLDANYSPPYEELLGHKVEPVPKWRRLVAQAKRKLFR